MAIGIKDGDVKNGIRYRFLETYRIKRHEVVLVKRTGAALGGGTETHKDLICECDFPPQRKQHNDDPHACPHKLMVRRKLIARLQAASLKVWKTMPLERAVLDVYRRHRNGEWLGQHDGRLLFIDEVAALLDEHPRSVLSACDRLRARNELDLCGHVLIDWRPGFRFPDEIRQMLNGLLSADLDWWNANDDGPVETFERLIGEGTGLKHDGRIFGPNSFPHLTSVQLMTQGLAMMLKAWEISKSGENEEDAERVAVFFNEACRRLARCVDAAELTNK